MQLFFLISEKCYKNLELEQKYIRLSHCKQTDLNQHWKEEDADELHGRTTRRRPPPIQLLTVDKFPSMASMRRSASLALMEKREIFCDFCKNNGEGLFIFNSHKLKDDNDKLILCQIVREYECPNCHASRDQAHTLKSCPLSGRETLAVGLLRLT